MDQLIIKILVYSGMVLGSALVLLGIYGLIKRETFFYGKSMTGSDAEKLTGAKAIKVSLYYLLAGAIWVWYSISRLVDF